jgi:hypothetical protein
MNTEPELLRKASVPEKVELYDHIVEDKKKRQDSLSPVKKGTSPSGKSREKAKDDQKPLDAEEFSNNDENETRKSQESFENDDLKVDELVLKLKFFEEWRNFAKEIVELKWKTLEIFKNLTDFNGELGRSASVLKDQKILPLFRRIDDHLEHHAPGNGTRQELQPLDPEFLQDLDLLKQLTIKGDEFLSESKILMKNQSPPKSSLLNIVLILLFALFVIHRLIAMDLIIIPDFGGKF